MRRLRYASERRNRACQAGRAVPLRDAFGWRPRVCELPLREVRNTLGALDPYGLEIRLAGYWLLMRLRRRRRERHGWGALWQASCADRTKAVVGLGVCGSVYFGLSLATAHITGGCESRPSSHNRHVHKISWPKRLDMVGRFGASLFIPVRHDTFLALVRQHAPKDPASTARWIMAARQINRYEVYRRRLTVRR